MKNAVQSRFIIKKVILNLIQGFPRWLLQFVNSIRGRFQIKFGMTLYVIRRWF